jgi:hypothetical protein
MHPRSFFLGWDLGGWNCDHNSRSRDAIAILDADGRIVGEAWRGNLRESINRARTAREWLAALFGLCKTRLPEAPGSITMGIDIPLGFSDEFRALICEGSVAGDLGGSSDNPYLYRRTERFLFERGIRPLSPVKDMIGSQATKGIHALAKFAPLVESCGVWTDGSGFRAIEAYPSAAKKSRAFMSRLEGAANLGHEDLDDARICALLALLFEQEPGVLVGPPAGIPDREGWIWFPE